MNDSFLIKFKNLSKEYILGNINFMSFIQRNKNLKKKIALDNISVEIHSNERIAILGKNGSGKSTLLKILSRITTPSAGEVIVKGRVLSMLETGIGFHPEFTTIENIYLNASMLGANDREIKKSLDLIINFAGLEEFLHVPLKKFSSGMISKLGFSIGIFLPSEILILDEILSVVDGQFRKKCIDKINESGDNSNKTLLFVSHNLDLVKSICKTGVVLNNGKLAYHGNIDDALNFYKKSIL
jgi:lipopolysaccharide transport system ATP-binding protein